MNLVDDRAMLKQPIVGDSLSAPKTGACREFPATVCAKHRYVGDSRFGIIQDNTGQ